MRFKSGPWGFGAGILLGFVIGSTSLAMATFGYKGWQRFSRDFQVGYLTGFLDMANLARNLDPDGFIEEKYPTWPKATLADWHNAVNKLYQDPENQQYGMYAMMRLAGAELEKKYGPPPSAAERLTPAFKQQIEKARKVELAARAKAGDKPAPAAAPPAAPPAAAAPERESGSGVSGPRWHHKRRRCPCPDEEKDTASQEKAAENAAAALSLPDQGKAATATEPGKTTPGPPSKP